MKVNWSFLDDIFSFGQSKKAVPSTVGFGRYTDVYKSQAQYDAWDKSMQHFDKEEFMDAFREFFKYLAEPESGSLKLEERDGSIHFEIQQGSRLVTGFANAEKIKTQCLIAKAETTNVGFMRRLMEFNFGLKYSRFALTTDNFIAILFDSYGADGSPLKLYHALKELAVAADKQDDLLLDEFKMLEPAPRPVIIEIGEAEKEAKYEFLKAEIERVFKIVDANKPDSNQYPGGYAYLLLGLAYKLDYLVRPEGFMMETLEKMHREYFGAAEDKTVQWKIGVLRKEFQKLLERPKEEYFKEMYRTRSTFGITTPVSHDKLVSLIESELPSMDWYFDQKHMELAVGIPTYIVGYSLFNFALPKPDRDMLHLFMQLLESEFFEKLGFDLPFFDKNGISKKAVLRDIKNISEANEEQYPKFKPDTSQLDFSGAVQFFKSFLWMLKDCDLTKKE